MPNSIQLKSERRLTPLSRVHGDASQIGNDFRGTNEPYHSIEILAALSTKHKKILPDIAHYINPIASKWGNKAAADAFESLDKKFLRMGRHVLPLDSDTLDRLSRDLAATCKATIARHGYSVGAVRRCNFHCKFNGVSPLKERRHGLTPRLNRYADESWWKRAFRKTQNRKMEHFYRFIGLVQRNRQTYVSDWNLSNRRSQLDAHRSFFKQFDVVNELGEVLELEDAVKNSIANPKNRRHELMARMSGFEKVAAFQGDACLFCTVTAPSRFHRTNASGRPNPKFDGSTPQEAQQWLRLIWSRVRASFARQEIQIYGFRIAEPHHDGTPHWHLLLFLKPDLLRAAKETLLQYWLAEDSDEPGAIEHRVRFIDIDPTKGSATGYVAKYVSKSIDGEHLDSDSLGIEAKSAADRIVASCTTWGIRQFQQIGGPPVTIWREFRRAAAKVADPFLQALQQYADRGDWKEFVMKFGGPTIGRRAHPVCLLKVDLDPAKTKYGDMGQKRVVGILRLGFSHFLTRLHKWELVPKPSPVTLTAMAS